MEKVVIRQCREITARGVSYIRMLYAQGCLDQNGKFHLERCVGRYGPKTLSNREHSVTANRAA